MRLFSKSKKNKKTLPAVKTEHWWYPLTTSRNNYTGHNYLSAYRHIAAIRMVINKRADCLGNAVPYVLDHYGNEPACGKAAKLRKLFETPNFFQSFAELYVLKEVYRLLYGWCALYTPRAYKGAIPYAMFVVPPTEITFKLNDNKILYWQKNPCDFIAEIKINGLDTANSIDPNDLIIFRDTFPCPSNPLISESRMSALYNEYDLTSAISEAEMVLVERQGALGILSKDANEVANTGVFEDERREIQNHYRDSYGMQMEKDQILITQTALKWQQIAMPTKDLMLVELDQEAQKKIAGVYNVPYNLLPGGSDSTFSNQQEAKKALYQETAIPVSESDSKKFTQALLAGHGLFLKLDYSDLYLFQDDLAQKAQTMSAAVAGLNAAKEAGNITAEEWRREMSKYIDIDPLTTIR